MTSRVRKWSACSLALCMALLSAAPAMAEAKDAAAASIAPSGWMETIARPSEEREALYLKMAFNAGGLRAGDVLSGKPFVVVSEAGARDSDAAAKVRVWTGWLSRVDDDLRTMWDELWIGPDGSVILAVADLDAAIVGYFQSPSQSVYRNLEYVGVYPWADIPTDPEADAAHLPKFAAYGTTNLYGLEPEGEADLIDAPAAPLPALPDRIRPGRVFHEIEIGRVPKDIENHWARGEILDLMRKGIVTGYDDGTIRPQNTLSRSEFLALLMRGLQIAPAGAGAASSYIDAASNWAGGYIAEAERLGIIPKGDGKSAFGPNEPLSRAEMAEWIAAALTVIERTEEGPPVSFKDTDSLDEPVRRAIRKAVNHGVIKGLADGTFGPERTLTRAEAFAVASRLAGL